MTGPMLAACGAIVFAGARIGARVPCASASASTATVAPRSMRSPVCDGITFGREFFSSRRAELGVRSNRRASCATYAATRARLNTARNPSDVPGATVRAFATAVSAQIVTRNAAGETMTFVCPTFRTTGLEYLWRRAAVAASEVSPPTSTPPTTTPSGTVGGAGGVSPSAGAASAHVSARATRRARRPTARKG